MKKFFLPLCAMGLTLMGCANTVTVNNRPVEKLDLSRYLGTWYEIARYDHSFERGMTNTTATYTLNTDGTVRVENSGWKKGKMKTSVGKAKLTDTPALLRVSFFGPFYSDYRVMMLSPDYAVAVIGSSNSKYLWILAREPMLDYNTKNAVLSEIRRRGYDTELLIWVDQKENIHWNGLEMEQAETPEMSKKK